MHRFFSTFPGSWPGIGLLVLRVAVAGLAAVQGAAYLSLVEEPATSGTVAALLAIASAVAILIGFVTPLAACVTILSTAFLAASGLPPSTPVAAASAITPIFLTADALSLLLLGPGALSLDARLFGRREIIIPHERDPQ